MSIKIFDFLKEKLGCRSSHVESVKEKDNSYKGKVVKFDPFYSLNRLHISIKQICNFYFILSFSQYSILLVNILPLLLIELK